MIRRQDLGSRIGGEKAQLPDEFLTRSQVIPGRNISFSYLDNYDVQINALINEGGSPKAFKFFHASVPLSVIPDNLENNIIGDTEGTKFSKGGWIDLYHNFNLSADIHRYSAWINDLREGFGTSSNLVLPLIKLVAMDKNTVRLYAAVWDRSFNNGNDIENYDYEGLVNVTNGTSFEGQMTFRSKSDDRIKVTIIAE